MWLFITRTRMAPGSVRRRSTVSSVSTTARLLDVLIPRCCIAYEYRYSLSIELTVALPSPLPEYGVWPDPFSWISYLLPSWTCSPSIIALPSPKMVKRPYWWPAYAWAIGSSRRSWPARMSAVSFAVSNPSSAHSPSLRTRVFGLAMFLGVTLE